MNIRKIALATALAAAPLCAAQAEDGLSYNYLQASYINVDIDDTDTDADGVEVEGSGLVADHLFVFGSYTFTDTDDITFLGATGSFETNLVALGLGYRMPIGEMMGYQHDLDFVTRASVLWADTEGQGAFADVGADDDDVGYRLSAGARAKLAQRFELNGDVIYTDIFDDDDFSFRVGAVFDITPMFAALATYATGDEIDTFTVGARWNFGRM